MKKILLVITLMLVGCGPDKAWLAFKVAHSCKIVAKEDSSTSLTSGGHIIINNAKVTYKCDDGILYTRVDGE